MINPNLYSCLAQHNWMADFVEPESEGGLDAASAPEDDVVVEKEGASSSTAAADEPATQSITEARTVVYCPICSVPPEYWSDYI